MSNDSWSGRPHSQARNLLLPSKWLQRCLVNEKIDSSMFALTKYKLWPDPHLAAAECAIHERVHTGGLL